MTSFVSQNVLDEERRKRKERRRNAREEILRDAKEKFLREKRKKELRESRGDDVWVAAGVSARLGGVRSDAEESEKKKKRDKKGKKHKRNKKHSRKEDEDEEESSSSEGEPVWVEKDAESAPSEEKKQLENAAQQAPLERDEWMKLPLAPSAGAMDRLACLTQNTTSGRKRQSKEESEEKRELSSFDRPGQHPLELNPYWKEGGCGLPTTEVDPPTTEPVRITDGGRSWLLRSYKRALERVEEGQASLEEVASERWGSLEKLYSLLEEAGIDPKHPDREPASSRRRYLYSHFDHDARERKERSRHNPERGNEKYGSSRVRRERSDEESLDSSRRGQRYGSSRSQMVKRETDFVKPRLSGGFMKPSENEDDSHGARHRDGLGWRDGGLQSSQSWRKKRSPSGDKPTSPAGTAASSVASSLFPGHLLHPPTSSRACLKGEDEDTTTSQPTTASCPSPPNSPRKPLVEEDPVSSQPVTDSQVNALAAKLVKAELTGNAAKVAKLKDELERLRQRKREQKSCRAAAASSRQPVASEKTVVLAKTDRFGRVVPVDVETGARRDVLPPPRTRYDTHTSKGKRRKYFADDDHLSLQDLVRQEMTATAEETRAAIARMASKFTPAANSDETIDDALDSKATLRRDPQRDASRQAVRAMAESRKMTQILEECRLCFGNPGFEKHLLIAVGLSAYLAVPATQPLAEGHCYIVPMEHATCSLHLDENVWSEIGIFRKGLTRMFSDHGLDVVFTEMYSSVKRKGHTYIECIPLPKEVGELAPMYFKKAISEADEEWSQNRKLIDTRKKGIRGSIPVGLPYFFVEFGTDGGYGHIVEDQAKFPHYFAREVCGGMLDVEPRLWLKSHRESFERQKSRVVRLSEWWAPYDWTQKLKDAT